MRVWLGQLSPPMTPEEAEAVRRHEEILKAWKR